MPSPLSLVNTQKTHTEMNINKAAIGNIGMIHVMSDVESRFERASQKILNGIPHRESAPDAESGGLLEANSIGASHDKVKIETQPAIKPARSCGLVITETEVITEECSRCDGTGTASEPCDANNPTEYQPHVWATCRRCDGKGKFEYRFPREIVKLAKKMEGQSALVIARTLGGLMLGFPVEDGQ